MCKSEKGIGSLMPYYDVEQAKCSVDSACALLQNSIVYSRESVFFKLAALSALCSYWQRSNTVSISALTVGWFQSSFGSSEGKRSVILICATYDSLNCKFN